MIGSSVALSISDIPFAGPTGAVNVGLVSTANTSSTPTTSSAPRPDLNLTVIRYQGRGY